MRRLLDRAGIPTIPSLPIYIYVQLFSSLLIISLVLLWYDFLLVFSFEISPSWKATPPFLFQCIEERNYVRTKTKPYKKRGNECRPKRTIPFPEPFIFYVPLSLSSLTHLLSPLPLHVPKNRRSKTSNVDTRFFFQPLRALRFPRTFS